MSVLAANQTNSSCTAVGYNALVFSTANNNTAFRSTAGAAMTIRANNIMIGAGATFQGSDSATSSNLSVIRRSIEQTKCYIGGICGRKTDAADAIAVLISSTGQLGTVMVKLKQFNIISLFRW